MRYFLFPAAAALLLGSPALADDVDAKAAAEAALAAKAEIPATPPTLPDQASANAKTVLENTAFGKKGDAERAAHSQAGQHVGDDAVDGRTEAATRSAQGAAASAARAANADVHAAAGQDRAAAARAAAGAPSTPTTPTLPAPATHR